MKRIQIAPSILSADFGSLDKEIRRVERAGADMIHIDIMDGHFVPNITIGPVVVRHVRRLTRLPLDVHLMIEEPLRFIDAFVDAGSDMITVHIETIAKAALQKLSKKLKSRKIKLGVSLNPSTPLARIKGVLSLVDFVLVMSVNPGFSGQKFMPSAVLKIRQLRALFGGEIAVDGGVNAETAGCLIKAGADILASGSYVFGAPDPKAAMERIRNAH